MRHLSSSSAINALNASLHSLPKIDFKESNVRGLDGRKSPMTTAPVATRRLTGSSMDSTASSAPSSTRAHPSRLNSQAVMALSHVSAGHTDSRLSLSLSELPDDSGDAQSLRASRELLFEAAQAVDAADSHNSTHNQEQSQGAGSAHLDIKSTRFVSTEPMPEQQNDAVGNGHASAQLPSEPVHLTKQLSSSSVDGTAVQRPVPSRSKKHTPARTSGLQRPTAVEKVWT